MKHIVHSHYVIRSIYGEGKTPSNTHKQKNAIPIQKNSPFLTVLFWEKEYG
jgi:hypothetical protein